MIPRKPARVSPYADACLRFLATHQHGARLSLGGAFALAFYFEYRETHDVDAWWEPPTTASEKRQVVECLENALREFGEVRTRRWGDVVSVDLSLGGTTVFSFQIAERDARLEPAQTSPWPESTRLDSFNDLVASKMVALVERGAPRDFRDIHALCAARVIEPRSCWSLWRRRQELAQRDTASGRARLAVETHLARIEVHRALESIADSSERDRAHEVREWFRKEFLDAVMA